MTDEQKLKRLAVKLHNWYLEAICELDDEHFNKKAQKSYKELSAEQQGIDIFIAKKVLELVSSAHADGCLIEFKELDGKIFITSIKFREPGLSKNGVSE